MNTLWTFGDSFTYGLGVKFESRHVERMEEFKSGRYYDIFEKYGNNPDKIWSELLSKKLNMKLKNLGICAISNDMIFDILIDNFNDIKEGDIVIVGSSEPKRVGIVYDEPINLDSIVGTRNHTAGYSKIYNKTAVRYNNIVSYENEGINKMQYWELRKKNKDSLMKYTWHKAGFKYPPSLFTLIDYRVKMQDVLDEEAMTNFKFVMDRLEERGVKTLLFNYTIWKDFERFLDVDDDDIEDWHWTIKGNSDFSDVVFDSLNKNEKILYGEKSDLSFSDESDDFIY